MKFLCLVHSMPGLSAISSSLIRYVSAPSALLTSIVSYGAIKVAIPSVQFLNRMAICFGLCLLVMAIITFIKPLSKPIEFKKNIDLDFELKTSNGAKVAGVFVVILTLILYALFSPIGLLK